MASPMPVPCGLVVKKASMIWSAISAGRPTLVSLTGISRGTSTFWGAPRARFGIAGPLECEDH